MTQPVAPPSQWSKLTKIQYLLDHRDLIFDPNTTSPFGAPGDGSGVPLLPLMASHPSIVELERALKLLLAANPGDYRHLAAYRWGAEYRIVWLPQLIRGPHGKMLPGEPQPRRQRVQPRWLRMDRVTRAEAFLEAKFGGDVFIPDELWKALHEPVAA